MTTQQVADKFYEYMQTGAFDKIYHYCPIKIRKKILDIANQH